MRQYGKLDHKNRMFVVETLNEGDTHGLHYYLYVADVSSAKPTVRGEVSHHSAIQGFNHEPYEYCRYRRKGSSETCF